MPTADEHLGRRLPQTLEAFAQLVAIPSISTDPEHRGDVRRAAEWVRDRMERAGLDAEIRETIGHPLVVGRHHAGPDAPTLVVYAHYDVQPADPLDEWRSPPFELTRTGDDFVARGAADDKAQVVLQIAAAEAALEAGALPVNLILLFEGEEEIGSPGLTPWLREHADEVATDHAIIADSMMFGRRRPSLIFGMRGLAYTEIEVRVGNHDLHSGQYGGAVPNPALILARILASFHDGRGRVAIEGFYDQVLPLTDELREQWGGIGFDEQAFAHSAGGATLSGEEGFFTHERIWARPCLDVNGMVSGYTGPGKKTVLPAVARAKVSCRLAPEQEPERIVELIERHVRERTPAGVQVSVQGHQANRPFRSDPNGPLFEAAARALGHVYGVEPVRIAGGGTLPIARDFAELLTPSVAVLGFALPGANMHAPNEWIPVEQIELGARSMMRLYEELARAHAHR
jgi:acetylornithine deacetylase/succinyl-diaminopimelate desuccinylase-like protein